MKKYIMRLLFLVWVFFSFSLQAAYMLLPSDLWLSQIQEVRRDESWETFIKLHQTYRDSLQKTATYDFDTQLHWVGIWNVSYSLEKWDILILSHPKEHNEAFQTTYVQIVGCKKSQPETIFVNQKNTFPSQQEIEKIFFTQELCIEWIKSSVFLDKTWIIILWIIFFGGIFYFYLQKNKP